MVRKFFVLSLCLLMLPSLYQEADQPKKNTPTPLFKKVFQTSTRTSNKNNEANILFYEKNHEVGSPERESSKHLSPNRELISLDGKAVETRRRDEQVVMSGDWSQILTADRVCCILSNGSARFRRVSILFQESVCAWRE